ncbi:DUF927 domain-containing protein [Shewanella algae]|uniref:DUF927 domain-containing protein n=1 Tax=Shewanella algae TaxID=38313 RepID=UPI001F26CC43|nr:DUF927 domain-containing protein [Shewanella algae]MCE9780241.1 DUF927 domain-containing protein [Shewanella algae]MCE9826848.1 DUF927 domain-containing protein [Shewanella algae]
MGFHLTETHLECLEKEEHQVVGGWIKVIARTRKQSKKHGFGALIQWRNMDGVLLQDIVFNRVLHGDQSRLIRDALIDSGYWLEPYPQSWSRLQRYLLQEILKAPAGICVDSTGWHDSVYVTQDWCVGTNSEPYYYAGQLNESMLKRAGTLSQWQSQVGALCVGNPLMIFVVGVALSAPLLHPAAVENGIFHLVGPSSTGKTSLLELAASVYSDRSFVRSWISTANGLAAVAAEQHDMMLGLDEIGLARPEDVDIATYHIVAGTSKLRATESGGLAKPSHWRTLALSTGEVWLSEVFESLGKRPKAGQQIRLVEIPVFGQFGAFDVLHRFQRPQLFVDHVKSQTSRYYGSLFPEWMNLLTSTYELAHYTKSEIQRLVDQWRTSSMSSQVIRVLQRFALVATALALASRNYLVPWDEEESIDSVKQVLGQWLAARGHVMNTEEHQVLARLKVLLPKWEKALSPMGQQNTASLLGYSRDVNGERQWLIDKSQFLRQLEMPGQYMREVMPLLQRGWLTTNEPERATLKLMVNGRSRRFFALLPDRIFAGIQELEIDD